MRQRKVKNLDEKLESLKEYIIERPEEHKGTWAKAFGNDGPIYLEIGCGKGKFTRDMALTNADSNFIAVEGQLTVALRALEKAEENQIENIKYLTQYIEIVEDFFAENELSGIFLNFSDPWPKAKHEKRRLTYGQRLKSYCRVVKDGGFIKFRTDNEGLFEYTLEQIDKVGLRVRTIERDLHNSGLAETKITTEYEDKFSQKGKNINFVEITV